MSLEQALADNTAAIRDLIAAFTRTDAPATVEKPKRATKKESADAAPATKYYFSEKNNTVYEVRPGEPDVVLGGAVEVTKAEFEAHKVRLSQEFAHLSTPGNVAAATEQAPVAPAAKTTPTPDVPFEPDAPKEVSNEQLMQKVVALSQRTDGRAQMEKILAVFGVPKFSLLPGQRRAEALAAVEKVLAA